MAFNSITFLLFFSIVYGLYWILPGVPARKTLLLLASYLFYGAWSPPFVFLLFLSTTLDWWLARLIGKTDAPNKRRWLLYLSIAGNLTLLGYFKYGAFLQDNFVGLLAWLGITYQPMRYSIILPLGISFYTFASLSYTIDVYRRDTRSDWKLTDYMLFVSFFPHLIAGPILRARHLLPQIESLRKPNANEVGWGLAMFSFGLFCKVVMADGVLAPVVDAVYSTPRKFGMMDTWIAVLAFSGQIYYDFGGYSLCAIGLARCFGIYFPENFRHPYAAVGFADFWHRWHITLSTWLRDYLYIPLGGSRCGEMRLIRNLLATMLIGGLWHGASWMFVAWGGLHGLYLVVERAMVRCYCVRPPLTPDKILLLQLLTFLLVSLTWIPFRAPSYESAYSIFLGLGNVSIEPLLMEQGLLALVAIMVTVRWHMLLRDKGFEATISLWRPATQVIMITGCLVAIFFFSGGEQRAFIYFQF